ncbi:S-adenosyl-L-methionine-dependent methyltransferase [Panaeolus papilionaceus]|nr:S-adenosyl-L-methionine-dependent methyltransferase [Panaeolus papilionaceus]
MNFYFEAAKTLDLLDAKKGSIKGIIAKVPEKDRKRTAALVIETLKFKPVLLEVIQTIKLMKEERKLKSLNLALVLVHDLILARGIQAGDGPIKQAILRHKTRLNGEFQKLKIKRGASSNQDLANTGDERAASIPRYVRVNTNLSSQEEVVSDLTSRGFTLSDPWASKQGFSIDSHVPNLLCFSPEVAFHDDHLYTSGKIILQDKASCFPAIVLFPPASDDAVVIDATSAPGNKTSHLSALMQSKGTLYAFERDRNRFSTLKNMLAKAGCKNVSPINADFLTVDPLDPKYSRATHILLDPSCSGSGIVNRLDYLVESDTDDTLDEARLAKLAAFQLLMIQHAMRFPNVKKIVYSTCSVHEIEDEHVVQKALESSEAQSGSFQLASRKEVIPTWLRRGKAEAMKIPEHADSVIRCLPGEDATNGFFVSCFIKGTKDAVISKRKERTDDEEEQPQSSNQPSRKKKKKNRKK